MKYRLLTNGKKIMNMTFRTRIPLIRTITMLLIEWILKTWLPHMALSRLRSQCPCTSDYIVSALTHSTQSILSCAHDWSLFPSLISPSSLSTPNAGAGTSDIFPYTHCAVCHFVILPWKQRNHSHFTTNWHTSHSKSALFCARNRAYSRTTECRWCDSCIVHI